MIRGIFVVSLFAFAHAQIPYANFADKIEDAEKQLEDQILSMDGNIPNITDSRRHYAVLLTHIALVAASIAEDGGPTYERVYVRTLPESIAIALTEVEDVISDTTTAIELLNNDTREIQELFETICTEATPKKVCSQLIDQAVKNDSPRYEKQAEMTYVAGTVAEELLNADFITVAKYHDEMDYLLSNMDALKHLIMSLVDLLLLIDRRSR